MPALFRKKEEKTFLLLDVENGSVATALVRLSGDEHPKLFAEHRVALPILHSLSSEKIAQKLTRAVDESLGYTSEVAANMRQHETLHPMGVLSGAHIFFSPPWVTTGIQMDRLSWLFEPELLRTITLATQTVLGGEGLERHPFGKAAAYASGAVAQGRVLLCIITGEVLELLVLESGRIERRATAPVGLHTVLRTLSAHAGMQPAEAHSAFRLHTQIQEGSSKLDATLLAVSDHFIEQFSDIAQELLHAYPVRTIVVVGPEPVAEWFARQLSGHGDLARLFPQGGVTKALRPRHLMPYLAAHAQTPDLSLMAEAMFVHANHGFA